MDWTCCYLLMGKCHKNNFLLALKFFMYAVRMGDCRKYPYPYHGWHLGILRERGVSWTGILKACGVMQFGIPKVWGRFPERGDDEGFT